MQLRHHGIASSTPPSYDAYSLNAEGEDFSGQLDTSYTAFTLHLKGQI